jgi:hypothetical protein
MLVSCLDHAADAVLNLLLLAQVNNQCIPYMLVSSRFLLLKLCTNMCCCCCWRRFDIMWLLLDETDEQNDMRLAAHIINVHQGRVGTAAAAAASNAAGSSSSSTVSTWVHWKPAWCFIMLCSHLCPCQAT